MAAWPGRPRASRCPAKGQPSQAASLQEAALVEERAARAAAAAEAAGAAAAAAAAAEADLAAVRAEAEARLREHYEASRCAWARAVVRAKAGARHGHRFSVGLTVPGQALGARRS
jgi:hypothetical protein